jgi:hypothetical protein
MGNTKSLGKGQRLQTVVAVKHGAVRMICEARCDAEQGAAAAWHIVVPVR